MKEFDDFIKEATAILSSIKKQKAKQVSSVVIKRRVKKFVFDYFQNLRPSLLTNASELDGAMQGLMVIRSKNSSVAVYNFELKNVRRFLEKAELENEIARAEVRDINVSRGEDLLGKVIIETLEGVKPSAALSYRQALDDIKVDRFSYRGTAVELRETLREVLDHLATDENLAEAGIKIEKDQNGYIMRQKVRYILKNRGVSTGSEETLEDAAAIVDDSIAKLIRATYGRGSVSTHTPGAERREILLLKKYLDIALCELLEIPIE